MKTHTLVIIFNRFKDDFGLKYLELIYDKESCSLEEKPLSRRPRAARFDRVIETGEGSYNQYNSHLATGLFGHPLERKQ
jgi:hypothetical protein